MPGMGSPGFARVWACSSSAGGCGWEGKREGAGEHVEPWRCGSGKTVETVLLQARHPGSFIAWGRARRPAVPQTPAPALPALQGDPGPAAASSSGSLLGFPWGTKGDSEDGGAGRAGGGSRVLGSCTHLQCIHPHPQLLPPQPRAQAAPPARTPRDVAQPGAALVVPVLHGDTTAVPGKPSSCSGCSTTNSPNRLWLHSEMSVTTGQVPTQCRPPNPAGATTAPPAPALPITRPAPNAFGRDVERQIARAGFSPCPCRLSASVVRFPTSIIRLQNYY